MLQLLFIFKAPALPVRAAVTGLVALALVVGCGEQNNRGVDLYQASGVLSKAGQPLANATLTLYPTSTTLLPPGVPYPTATTNEEGEFDLGTFAEGDGSPPGDYVVTVRLLTVDESSNGPLEEADLLRGAFADPRKPAATVTIEEGSTELEPIDLGS